MKMGTLVIRDKEEDNCPVDCIPADGKWYAKQSYPGLYQIFKNCKCIHANIGSLTTTAKDSFEEKGVFHVPNSHGRAWIVCKDIK